MTGIPKVVYGAGSLSRLPSLLNERGARSCVLVTGRGAWLDSVPGWSALGDALAGRVVRRLSGVSPNPALAEVLEGARVFRQTRADAVIAVGGGSVMDFAKLALAFAGADGATESGGALLSGAGWLERRRRHVLALVPTTAGTGSEVTSIAVVIVGDAKRSLAHEGLRCDLAVIDPELTATMPGTVAAATGTDALSQGVESYWSVHATERSRGYAREAIGLAAGNLGTACLNPDPAARGAMALAALQSGHAIERTQTTAPHALSYMLTAGFGVPHGHACGVFLGPVLEYNAGVTAADVADERGVGYVRARMAEILDLLGAADAAAGRRILDELMARLGLATRLGELGVRRRDVGDLADAALGSPRLAANPRVLDRETLCGMITARM